MAKFIKKRFPALFVATYFIVAVSMVGYLIYPAIFGQASVAADFTNNGAATATWGPSYTDRLVMDVTLPDAWNGVAYTADTLYYDAGTTDAWQGDTLNVFPALGTITGVGYVENLVDPGFQTTEAVVADLDADSVVTTAADDLVDGDGSGSTGIGTVDPAAAGGDPLLAMGDNAGHGGLAICADSLFPWVLTALRIDTNGDCTDGTQTEGTYLVGTNATAAAAETNGTWAFGDAVTMGGNGDGDYDDGEDIFYENNVGELTYSAAADGSYIVGAVGGSTISDFPADCDGAGAGSEACKYTGAGAFDGNSNIYIDDGTAGGAAPNSEVDRQDDQFIGIGVQNTGTAVDTTDIEFVEFWADAGAVGFQGLGFDTPLGKLSVNSLDNKEWTSGGVTQPVSGTLRIFVTVDVAATPTNGRTLKFQIPIYNDAGGDGGPGADGDVGIFMSSTNDGPTNAVVLNANIQTIDSDGPTVTSRVTADSDGNGKIDRIIFTTNENLDDDFTALTIDITGYAGEAYVTGGGATDNIFWVNFTEGASMDTDATPDTQIAANTTLSDAYSNNIAVDGAPVASTDGAVPVLIGGSYRDLDSNGAIDTLRVAWSESVTMTGSTGVDWTITGGTVNAAFASAADSGLGTDFDVTVTADPNKTGGVSAPTIAYDNGDANNSVVDTVSNPAGTTGPVTLIDLAAPVIVTTSPADNATDAALDASMVITFSEAMTTASVTGEISRTPTFTLGTAGWTSGDTVLTYASHDAWAGLQLYTITLSGNIASAATTDGNLGAGPVANPFDFTTVAATSGGGGGGGGLPASVTVTAPNGGEVWAGLSSKNITWSSTSTTISKAKLYYSLDRGVNFPYTIATNENNDGTYSWTVPNIPSGTVKVKVEGYDESGAFVASDISDADFTITYTTPSPAGEEIPSAENPAGLVAGDLLKSPLSTTVYYFGSDNKRHIFPNEKTYKSWYPDWSNVKSVTAEELRAIPLGKNVTVRVGTVLVKIDTNPKVYAVEPGGLLRWVPTETRAVTLYGSAWATKIIDVPLAFWGDYSFGTDISTDTHPTGALVQYTGTTNKYYIQGAEKRLISTVGFTANNFRNEYVLPVPTTLYYAPGADITAAENAISRIY